jgi:hypothetical protein
VVGKYLYCNTLPLADDAGQQVLGADVVVTEVLGLAKGQLQDFLGSRREWWRTFRRR